MSGINISYKISSNSNIGKFERGNYNVNLEKGDRHLVYMSKMGNGWGGTANERLGYFEVKTTLTNYLNLSGTLLTRLRTIFGLTSNQYINVEQNSTWLYSNVNQYLWSSGVGSTGTIDAETVIENMSFSLDDTLPLVIDEYTANFLTNKNIQGTTVDTWTGMVSGQSYRYLWKDTESGRVGNVIIVPAIVAGDNPSFYYGITTGNLTNDDKINFLEWLIDGCESYEDLSFKFYQTPPTSKITYDVKANLNSGDSSLNFSIDREYKGESEYESNVTTNVYTSYNGVQLNRQTVGLVGNGTGYEIIGRCVNSSGNVVLEDTLGVVDSPSYPYSINLDNFNLGRFCGAFNGTYKMYIYLKSYRTEYSLTLNGNVLVQNRVRTLNGSTETEHPIYFSFAFPFKNTNVDSPEVNASNSGIRFFERLNIEYLLKNKEPITPIPDSPIPSLIGFNKVFKLASLDVVNFNSWLWGTDDDYLDLETYKKINQNPLDNIMFLKVSPFNLTEVANYPVTIGNLTWGESTYPKVDTYSTITIGTFRLNRVYNDFRDFTMTSYRMYLPFVGFVELDQKLLFGYDCTLKVKVNSDTFQAMYDLRRNADNMVVGQWECNVGLDFPLTSGNLSEYIVNFATSSFKAIASGVTPKTIKKDGEEVKTLNTSAITSGIGDIIESGTSGLDISYQNPSSNSAMSVSRWCYIEVIRNEYEEPTNYAHTFGKPCNKTLNLSACRGYTQINNVDLSQIACTELERDMIQSLLANGIYL